MTVYTFNLGAGGERVLILHKNLCTLDGEEVSKLEALKFLQDANKEGLVPQIEERS